MTPLNDYFGFTHSPFGRNIPAKDLFPARGHQDTCAARSAGGSRAA